MIDRWIERLSLRQAMATFVAGMLVIGGCVSVLVVLAAFSPQQAALAFLVSVSVIFLVCLVRVGIRVAGILRP